MKPWDIKTTGDKKPGDEFIIPLWQPFTSKDFYYTIQYQKDTKMSVLYIVPIEFFDRTGHLYHDSIPIMHLLPSYLEEIMECIYETNYNPDYVCHHMNNLGFCRSRYFDTFIRKNNGIFGGYSNV